MGRHSSPRRTPKAAAVVVPAVAVAGVIGALVYANQGDDTAPASASSTATTRAAGLAGCSQVTPLRVTTTDDMEPVVSQVVKRLEGGSGGCVDYTVTAQGSAVTASGLMSGADETTQVWIPDSGLWAQRVAAAAPAVRLEQGPVVATSPLVFTIPHAYLGKVPYSLQPWSYLLTQKAVELRVGTPERSTASLLAMLHAQQGVASAGSDQRQALQGLMLKLSGATADERELRRQAITDDRGAATFPASEQQLHALNVAHPDGTVGAALPREGTSQFDYRLVTVGGRNAPDAKAVEALRSGLTSPEGVETLRKAGFRVGGSGGPGVDGVPAQLPPTAPAPRPQDAEAALRAWVTMSQQTRMLAVIDTSESMKKEAYQGLSRLDLAKKASLNALQKFPEASQIGLWSFDLARPEQRLDWEPLVPVKALNDSTGGVAQRQLLGQKAAALTWHKANGTALNDTILAAYEEMQRSYQPDFANAVILLTDGKNEDPGSISEADLVARLKQASQDSSRPVRLILLGISREADQAALRRIAAAVPDGHAYDASQPENIYAIMEKALTMRGAGS